MPTTTKVDCSM